MGGQQSLGLCSVEQPCGVAIDNPNRPRKMDMSDMQSLQADRINAWTKDLGPGSVQCGQVKAALTCDTPTAAPESYLADTQNDGAILLDARVGPIWLDDEGEDQVVAPQPGELSAPRAGAAAQQKRSGLLSEDRVNLAHGQDPRRLNKAQQPNSRPRRA